jgi:hypothetical protein
MKNETILGLLGLIISILGFGCGADPVSRMTPEERIDRLQDLLIRGVAHSEIGEWPEAIEQFSEALPLADGDPVVAFGLAVAHFRSGDPEIAREWLDRIDETAPEQLRGRVAYLRGKLALEAGDVDGEAEAYRQAAEIDSSEPAYPYSLSQVVPRIGGAVAQEEVGVLLRRAAELWPDNGRIGAELAQWFLGRDDVEERQRGVDLVVELGTGDPDVEVLVSRGLEEFAEDPNRTPVSLRRALNLLRPGKRFQTDSASLEARLAVLPFARPVTIALRRTSTPAYAALTLQSAQLLPEVPFAGQERVLDVVSSNDAVEIPATGAREADLTILTDRGVWFLARDQEEFELVTNLDSAPRQLVVGELDGDGWMEILLLTADGMTLWGRPEGSWTGQDLEPELATAAGLDRLLAVDFEHDGDLDLLATDEEGALFLVTHRGEAGLGIPEPAPLPRTGSVSRLVAVDLDNDVDQDLVLVGEGFLRVLTNWRQGEYRVSQELALGFEGSEQIERLLRVDYDSDGHFDVVGLADGGLLYWHNDGLGGLVADRGARERARNLIDGNRVRSLGMGDFDLDGETDLSLVHSGPDGESRLSLLMAQGRPGLGAQIAWDDGVISGLTALDLDGDHDPDPLAWGTDGLAMATNTGAEGQGWLGLTLRGLVGKVPLDGRGARLDVSFGLDSRTFAIERSEMIVGLGGRTPALIKVTWPNGISEFLFEPESNAAHVIEQELRIEGSCPFLYASDGNEKRFVTDILGLAPLGMLAGPGRYVPPDPEEYLRLPDWVAAEGVVELSITEELREVAYLDQVELVVVDAPGNIEVYNGERWIEGFVDGLDLRLLSSLQTPAAVRDNRNRDVLDIVADLDQRYLTNHDGDRLYQGAVPVHQLEIELPGDVAASERAALVLTGWLHWGNTSTNLARAQDPSGATVFPYLEVPSREGGWHRVDLDVGLPAGKTKPVVVELTGILDEGDPRVRITTDFEVYWDQIAVAEALPVAATSHRVNRVAPQLAELSFGGFSSWYRPAKNGPFLFDYSDRRPIPWRENSSGERPIAWQEHEGHYTRFGTATDLVSEIDDRLIVFGAGEELALSFDVDTLPALPDGWKRTLFLHSEGWEKDGDPNVACGQTVGPLPSRAMGEYPCSGFGAVDLDEAAGVQRGDRWVDRRRLERRVVAWGSTRGMSSGR